MSQKTFSTVNPHNNQKIQDFEHLSLEQIQSSLEKTQIAFQQWSQKSFSQRAEVFESLKKAFTQKRDVLAQNITLEMGKPLAQAYAEIDKSISLIDFVVKNGPQALAGRKTESYEVVPQPLGIVYGVMPWNFPLWQVARFAFPALMAGNAIILKHADCVAGTAAMIGEVFESVIPGLFLNLAISHETSDQLIADPRIRAVSLTGSTRAGMAIAAQAGKNLKKCVLELGGNDAYVILPDADLDYALQKSFEARLLNAGQSCISAKRIFVHEPLLPTVLEKLKDKISKIKTGDPAVSETQMGPLARLDLQKQLVEQVKKSVSEGARIHYQQELSAPLKAGAYFPPTLLCDISEKNSAFREEFFGPVFSVITYKDEAEALRLANASMYGLGGAVFSKSFEKSYEFAKKMETGSVAINDYFRSAPEKPFGGIKNSGYGRELGSEGFHEFVNIKSLILPTSKTPANTVAAE